MFRFFVYCVTPGQPYIYTYIYMYIVYGMICGVHMGSMLLPFASLQGTEKVLKTKVLYDHRRLRAYVTQ